MILVAWRRSPLPTNLQLQIDQFILGPSHPSSQDRAGSHCRLRFSFISRYHRGCQGYPVKERSFNAPQPLATLLNQSNTPLEHRFREITEHCKFLGICSAALSRLCKTLYQTLSSHHLIANGDRCAINLAHTLEGL
jgi:hypothetical protein